MERAWGAPAPFHPRRRLAKLSPAAIDRLHLPEENKHSGESTQAHATFRVDDGRTRYGECGRVVGAVSACRPATATAASQVAPSPEPILSPVAARETVRVLRPRPPR